MKVKTIAIDEKSFRLRNPCITVVMDLDRPRLFRGTVGRDGDTLDALVEELKLHGGEARQNQDDCSYLLPAFIKGILEHLPKAEIPFDPFHPMNHKNEARDAVRCGESSFTPTLKKIHSRWFVGSDVVG